MIKNSRAGAWNMDVEKDFDVNEVEKKLAGTLRPISVRREYVLGLGRHIRSLGSSMRRVSASTWHFILLILAGLLSLGVVIALVAKALWRLFVLEENSSEQL